MPKKILVIEDEESIRNIIRVFLEDAGYAVFVAGHGLEGGNKFHEKRIIIFPAFSLPAYQIFILFTDTDQSYNTQKPWYLHNFQNKIAIPAFRPSEQRCQ